MKDRSKSLKEDKGKNLRLGMKISYKMRSNCASSTSPHLGLTVIRIIYCGETPRVRSYGRQVWVHCGGGRRSGMKIVPDGLTPMVHLRNSYARVLLTACKQ